MNLTDAESDNYQNTVSTFNSIITVLDVIILFAVAIIEALAAILIIYSIKRKNETFTSVYYYILCLGFAFNSFNIFMYKITYTVPCPDIYRQSFYNIIQWYNSRFAFFWNTVLAFNRFTAIFFFLKHKKIWSQKSLFLIMALLLLSPVISSSYTLGEIGCFFKDPYTCLNFYLPVFDGYIHTACDIVAFILGVTTALGRKIKGQKWAKKQKFETYLLIQSFVSSSLFLSYQVLDRIVSDYLKQNGETIKTDANQFIISQSMLAGVNYLAMIAHCSSAILIFCLSKAARESFINFYRLYYIPGIKKPQNHDETTVQSFNSTRTTIRKY